MAKGKTALASIVVLAIIGWLVIYRSETTQEALRPEPTAGITIDTPRTPGGRSVTRQRTTPAVVGDPRDLLADADLDSITHRAVRDGAWSDPDTWGGRLPGPGARVHIPSGHSVTIGTVDDTHIKFIQIDGELMMASNLSTRLVVDTILVAESGRFEAGTAEDPVRAGAEALVSILPYYDPNESDSARQEGAMFIAFGEVSLHGQDKTALIPLEQSPRLGDTVLSLQDTPENWQVGDLIAVAGNRLPRNEGETLIVVAVNGNQVEVRSADHTPESWQGFAGYYEPDLGRQNFAINLSRNVAIASTPPDGSTSTTQGSLLFYGDGVANASLANVGLYALGMREGKIDGAGSAQTRPAIKFQDGTGPIDVTNLVLVDAPDSSLDIDGSQVKVINSVAYDDDGGAWLTEGGSPSRLLWQGARPVPVVLR